ncbi:MAG: proteasome accessory factor PafA2 family protein, partial [Acidobacteriaceae bacterium]
MNNSFAKKWNMPALPKLCGADIELGNFIADIDHPAGSGYEASQALLAEIDGFPRRRDSYSHNGWSGATYTAPAARNAHSENPTAGGWGYNPQDVSRRYLASTGGSAYIDLDHCEGCLPEVLSAYDQVAAWHGMLAIVRSALERANEGRPHEQRIQVLVNNSDGLGHSYGSHLNFLISRRTFDNIFRRRPHYLQYLASLQISSILVTGQGKAGSENHRAPTQYQISQRADFFEILQGPQTTFERPIINSRDESLCGFPRAGEPWAAAARLHVIFFDSALAHGSALLRTGIMQLILTLLELGLVNARLILDDPLVALQDYSHDPTLKASARLIGGERFTALELQAAFLEEVKQHAARGVFEGVVPRAEEVIALWEDTLVKFEKGDLMALAPRLDWVMKLMAIERAMEQNPELEWTSPEVKAIDHLYSSLDSDGLYRAYEESGFAEQLVTPERIEHFATNPPEDTRAWTRAMLLRRASSEGVEVDSVDWDRMTFRIRGRYAWPSYRTIDLEDPLAFTRAEAEPIFDACTDFSDLLDGLREHGRGQAGSARVLTANSSTGED